MASARVQPKSTSDCEFQSVTIPGFVDLDVGVIGRFKSGAESFFGMPEGILCRGEVSRADAEKADDEERGQCGQDREAVFVGQRDEGGGETEADGGLTRRRQPRRPRRRSQATDCLRRP